MAGAWGWVESRGAPGALARWSHGGSSHFPNGDLWAIYLKYKVCFLLLIVRVPGPSVWCLKGLFDTDHHIEMALCSWGGQGRAVRTWGRGVSPSLPAWEGQTLLSLSPLPVRVRDVVCGMCVRVARGCVCDCVSVW